MSKIYRFTGPPENWITGIGISRWAVNDNNKGLWEKFEPGDIALLHSTAKSSYSNNTPSAVVGYAVIASKKWIKDGLWWIQEKQSGNNLWPYVFTLDEIYLFRDNLGIDFEKDNIDKSVDELKEQVERLGSSGIAVSELNSIAKANNATTPAFPVNGSASSVNEAYEEILLKNLDNFYQFGDSLENTVIEERLGELIDDSLSNENIDKVRNDALRFKTTTEGYSEKEGIFRIRKDNETQKRRIARIENHTCQVCGFYAEYKRANGKKGWIIQVDHIINKNAGGTEESNNLWVLCPNCHAKKTRGIISIDVMAEQVMEGARVLSIKDNHLWK
jgi:predicted HNH restriction endonuclease